MVTFLAERFISPDLHCRKAARQKDRGCMAIFYTRYIPAFLTHIVLNRSKSDRTGKKPDSAFWTGKPCISRLSGGKRVARPAGLEPATQGLENPCSIHLSYGRYDVKCARHFLRSTNGSRDANQAISRSRRFLPNFALVRCRVGGCTVFGVTVMAKSRSRFIGFRTLAPFKIRLSSSTRAFLSGICFQHSNSPSPI